MVGIDFGRTKRRLPKELFLATQSVPEKDAAQISGPIDEIDRMDDLSSQDKSYLLGYFCSTWSARSCSPPSLNTPNRRAEYRLPEPVRRRAGLYDADLGHFARRFTASGFHSVMDYTMTRTSEWRICARHPQVDQEHYLRPSALPIVSCKSDPRRLKPNNRAVARIISSNSIFPLCSATILAAARISIGGRNSALVSVPASADLLRTGGSLLWSAVNQNSPSLRMGPEATCNARSVALAMRFPVRSFPYAEATRRAISLR